LSLWLWYCSLFALTSASCGVAGIFVIMAGLLHRPDAVLDPRKGRILTRIMIALAMSSFIIALAFIYFGFSQRNEHYGAAGSVMLVSTLMFASMAPFIRRRLESQRTRDR
jgi:ABC-type Na+ efflux pump permease subunit